jgi:thioesterase domain-containing protein
MAMNYNAAIREVRPHGPYLLGGWSFGATLAFEMAQQLTRQGEEVKLVAILDSVPPDFFDWSENRLDDFDDPIMLVRTLEGAANREEPLPIAEDYLRQLSRDDQLLYIMEQAKKARIMPQELSLGQVKRSLENYIARVKALHTYTPEIYPGRMVLFRRTVFLDGEKESLSTDPTWGWGRHSKEPIDVCDIPGDHVSIVNEPDVQVLAEELNSRLSITGL